jgi:hypothetical protein
MGLKRQTPARKRAMASIHNADPRKARSALALGALLLAVLLFIISLIQTDDYGGTQFWRGWSFACIVVAIGIWIWPLVTKLSDWATRPRAK